MSKTARQASIIAAILLLAGGVYMFQYFKAQKKPPKTKPPQKAVLRPVETMPVNNQSLVTYIDLQGRIQAFDKMGIFAEVSGRLLQTGRPFKVGSYFKKGDLLMRIEDTEARLNLSAQKAALMNAITQMMPDLKIDYPDSFQQWKDYLDHFDVEGPIQPFPAAVDDREKYYVTSKNILNSYYMIKSAEERLAKYKVYAPFGGILTQTAINPGSLVRAGQKTGELMNTNQYELAATLRLSELPFVKTGNKVSLHSPDLAGKWQGTVKRISNQIDPNTQTVVVYIGVTGPQLKEGMYLRGNLASKTIDNAMEIPRDLIVNQNGVFLIDKDTTLQLQTVDIRTMNEETAVVAGLPGGATLLKATFPGAYNGQKVSLKPM